MALAAFPQEPAGYILKVLLAVQDPALPKSADATTPKVPEEPTTTV
jgi:hypothetical protein